MAEEESYKSLLELSWYSVCIGRERERDRENEIEKRETKRVRENV